MKAPPVEEVDGTRDMLATVKLALAEAIRAVQVHGAYASAHEGYAVLLEEVDELKAHVWAKPRDRDLAAMRAEAIQVAAVALRIACELCTEARGRR